MSDAHLNVPALLTIDLWMAMPEAHPLVLTLLTFKFWIAMLKTRLNVPALLAINCYMAKLETRLNVPALLAINCYIAILETRLNVPAVLAINFWMAMLETCPRNPKYCWTTTSGRQLVRCTSKRTSIVGHRLTNGKVRGLSTPHWCPTKTYSFIKLLVLKNISFL